MVYGELPERKLRKMHPHSLQMILVEAFLWLAYFGLTGVIWLAYFKSWPGRSETISGLAWVALPALTLYLQFKPCSFSVGHDPKRRSWLSVSCYVRDVFFVAVCLSGLLLTVGFFMNDHILTAALAAYFSCLVLDDLWHVQRILSLSRMSAREATNAGSRRPISRR